MYIFIYFAINIFAVYNFISFTKPTRTFTIIRFLFFIFLEVLRLDTFPATVITITVITIVNATAIRYYQSTIIIHCNSSPSPRRNGYHLWDHLPWFLLFSFISFSALSSRYHFMYCLK